MLRKHSTMSEKFTKLSVDGLAFALENCHSAKIQETPNGGAILEIKMYPEEGFRRFHVPRWKWERVENRYPQFINKHL